MSPHPIVRWATTSTRLLVGGAVAAATVVAVGVGVAFAWPSATVRPVAVTATPPPADTLLACDGPLLALGRDVEQAGALSVAADQSVVSGPADVGATAGTLAGPTDVAPATFSAAPSGSSPAAFAAAGSSAVESADLRGAAASACRQPLLESWLVGGSTVTGTNDLLVLSNPGTVAATVQLTTYGASGAQVAPGASDRVVPAGRQVIVPLAGLLPTEQSPVVRVTSTGAPVTASLQSSLVRVLTAVGVDRVSPLAAPATRLVIPGVTVASADASQGATTIVRALSADVDTVVRISVRGADGQDVQAPASLPLSAGRPAELELTGLPTGVYTVTVEADAPVVAGAWSTTTGTAGSDFAWYAAAPAIDVPTRVAVAPGAGAQLVVTGFDTDATVSITAPSGVVQELSVPAGGAAAVPVGEPGVYEVAPQGAIAAAVAYAADGALASYPVWGADAAAPPLVVYP
ncbi:DUF5719 family protein [Microbacterium sp. 10M-3C3]|jgi:hypothetical protein|uniref:DUF5719 family protein n=1 Tax=Microbacterium sp. 10M-3C3 TaxID=2483401 RepID=UPI000F640247|nr:DUF5719 family protein [Microbacterium sp. 10M-3C3]